MLTLPASFDFYAVDLFAGPGGWDVAAHRLGLRVLGIEWDAAACATRRAADLPTLEGDVRAYGPGTEFFTHLLTRGVRGFIASPPCQTFSMAGGGAGRRALDKVLALIKSLEAREELDLTGLDDDRTGLVLEPLRWVLAAIDAGHPFHWLAFEQVPTVLPVWEAMAEVLRREGYSVAVGKLAAEQYGVPQTRKRAILVARLDGEAKLPAPTHRPYKKGVAQDEGDPALQPWVSMAEALEWGMTARPYLTIACSSHTGGPDKEKVGGSAARATLYAEKNSGRWEWPYERPATTVCTRDAVGQPGHKHMGDCHPGEPRTRQFDAGSVRITLEEAARLQSFPAGHPWQGTKSAIFRQIGNAVPPGLAGAVLASVADLPA